MELGEKDIREFAEMWRDEFEETISPEDARHYASQILELYALLAGLPAAGTGSPPDSCAGVPQP